MDIPIKMVKLVNDPCFGKLHEQHHQCPRCWVKGACLIMYRNRKC